MVVFVLVVGMASAFLMYMPAHDIYGEAQAQPQFSSQLLSIVGHWMSAAASMYWTTSGEADNGEFGPTRQMDAASVLPYLVYILANFILCLLILNLLIALVSPPSQACILTCLLSAHV